MPGASSNSEAAILGRILHPEQGDLKAEAARALLTLAFEQTDLDRMQYLAARAREGILTSAEQEELESYERIGHLLAILQSKARTSLRTARNSG